MSAGNEDEAESSLTACPIGERPTAPTDRIGRLDSSGAGWTSSVGRQAHNLENAGSNPAPATKLPCGTLVSYGFSYGRGRVIEFQRRYGIDGYRVQDALPPGDYGALRANPRWVPVSELRCANCEHGIEQFHQPDGCWFSVAVGTVGANGVCPCSVGGG